MTIELVLLAASVVLGIVHIIILSHLQSCNEAIGGLPAQGNTALRRSPALPEGPNEHFETILRPSRSLPLQFLSSR
jgi:hypothetical protein